MTGTRFLFFFFTFFLVGIQKYDNLVITEREKKKYESHLIHTGTIERKKKMREKRSNNNNHDEYEFLEPMIDTRKSKVSINSFTEEEKRCKKYMKKIKPSRRYPTRATPVHGSLVAIRYIYIKATTCRIPTSKF